jgi:hypothetical protein
MFVQNKQDSLAKYAELKEALKTVDIFFMCKALTKDVDLTITNILEGRVQYKAEEPAVEADRTSSPSQATSKPTTVRMLQLSKPCAFR